MNEISDCCTLAQPPVELIRGASIFLDFDGTLVEISSTPNAVVIEDRLRTLLSRLHERLDGRVAILTGRAAANVAEMIAPASITIGGSHGLEMLRQGSSDQPERPHMLDAVLADIQALETEFPGVLVEDKPFGIAVHFRQAPHAEAACLRVIEAAAARTGMLIQPGKMVFELKPGGGDKGTALRKLMSEPAFAGTRPLFLGDDLTDEPAFAAARELGGAGILVGDFRETAANYRLGSVGEALDWLDHATEQLA